MQVEKVTDLKTAELLLQESITKNFGELSVRSHFRPQADLLLGDAYCDVALELAALLRRPAVEISAQLVAGLSPATGVKFWADREFINLEFDDTVEFLYGAEPLRQDAIPEQIIATVSSNEAENLGPSLVALAMTYVQVSACLDSGYNAKVASWDGQNWKLVHAEQWVKEDFFDLVRTQHKFADTKELIAGIAKLVAQFSDLRIHCWIAGTQLGRVDLSNLLRKYGQRKHGFNINQVGAGLDKIDLADLKIATEKSAPTALALYLASHGDAGDIDLEVASLAEADNLVWLTKSASARVASLIDPSGSDGHEEQLQISKTDHQLLTRLRFLPRFYEEAGQFGEVANFCRVLQLSLAGVLKILHNPELRLSQSAGKLSKNQLNFLSGIAQRLSAIVEQSRLFIR